MAISTSSRIRSSLWRCLKVLLGAWAFAVAGAIIIAVVSFVMVGPNAATSLMEHMRYTIVALFLLGIPVMLLWLK